ncbi:auxin-binding protein ABP19a-like [Chenopodium quinoa]|uniref:auxin-binding protein ABP19a-like n=1 Tax=Chenopodium quinoa TaxID=63459 RepID=UPI000B778D57|nr:auxin-binding protein ABP19a-like [Chenopodium quinoa]
MYLPTLLTFSLLVSISCGDTVWDFCVGDLSLPSGPSGYACKDPAKVTADDFVHSGLGVAGNTTNMFKFGASVAFSPQFPGLNGMGISMVRADLGVGGAVPIHTHRVAELLVLVEGTVIGGFIDSNNTAYYKTLHKGDIMIFPPQLLHFQVNVGSTPVVAYASFASDNPGVQPVDAVFTNDLPSKVVQKVTLLDHAQVKKLKKVFGGSN